jgi:hypothetical protein
MTPEIELVENYNTWFMGALADPGQLRIGLPNFIASDATLYEPTSIPWGGTFIGVEGWIQMIEKSGESLGPVYSDLELSSAEYFQRDNVVLREFTLNIKPSQAMPERFSIAIIEKYTVAQNRIQRVDEYYSDTAGLLKRLGVRF